MSTLYVNTIYPQSGDYIALSGNLEVSGTIKSYELRTITESTYRGSSFFGNDYTNDMHQFTGSLQVSGSGITLTAGGGSAATITLKADAAQDSADTTTITTGDGGDFTVDCAADIILDADGGSLFFKDAGTQFAALSSVDGFTVNAPLGVSGSVTLGDAAADVTTVTGQLTASQGILATLNSSFNANVTLGNAASDIITSTGQLTASQGVSSTKILSSGDMTLDFDGGDLFFNDAGVQQGVLKVDTGNKFILSSSSPSDDFYLMSGRDIFLDADGADITFQDAATSFLKFSNSSADCVITNGAADKDIMFKDAGGNEVFRMDGGEEALLMATNKKIMFHDASEYIVSDATDLTIASGGDIILNPSGGDVLPDADSTRSLGSPSKRWANIYTGDLHLRNNRGDWTILEEEDFLCVVNNKTGKKYKMMLQEYEE